MRELKLEELSSVAGAGDSCNEGNSYGGINNTNTITDELIAIYESLVAATSHVIERVATAL